MAFGLRNAGTGIRTPYSLLLKISVELVGNWLQTEELLYCVFYVKYLQQARELGEEEASERLGRMDQSEASIQPRKTAGSVPCFKEMASSTISKPKMQHVDYITC
jgi:hypothetical protein